MDFVFYDVNIYLLGQVKGDKQMEKTIRLAQGKAWAMYHNQLEQALIQKNMNRIDLSVKLVNGYFFDAAQRLIGMQLKAGVIDNMFKRVG